MKTRSIILGVLVLGFGLVACDKKQEPAVQVETIPMEEKAEPATAKEQSKPLTRAEQALKALDLKSLEIDAATLPTLPDAAAPSGNEGLDAAYLRWERMWQNAGGNSNDPEKMPLGGDEGWRKTSRYIIWGYGRPTGIAYGKRTLLPDMQGDLPQTPIISTDAPYIPLTLWYGSEAFLKENSWRSNRQAGHRFDSLTRIHGVVPGNMALHQNTPMPYDLRYMRIAHEGVDISPLFSIRYQDYKEVTRSGDYSKWYWRDVRISEVGMDVLDWIFDGYFLLYPLTKDYPRFTIIFILKDGTIISREVEHRI